MDEILQRFIEQAPVTVVVQATAARTISASTFDEIFEQHADGQYTRELTFSALAGLMTQVVFSKYPSVHAAYRKNTQIPVSITSVYNKLNGLGPEVSEALVSQTACAMGEIIAALPENPTSEPIKGLRVRTLDGNNLAGTDHRLACLRGSGAAALPGMSLVVRDGRTGLLTNIVQCEDAYTNERTLHPEILALVEPNDLWIADRNFCTDDYLSGIESRGAYFLIRHHGGVKLHPLEDETASVPHAGATICEQKVRVGSVICRCVIVRLGAPLRDGTTEIRVLTNVPEEWLSTPEAADMYRGRWRIETAFQELTDNLRCEINTLGYPKAALFGFALAIVAYNLLVVTRAAITSGLGEEVAGGEELSSYYMATEMAAVHEGMLIAMPGSAWRQLIDMTTEEFARWLHDVTRNMDWRPYRKTRRGPKKPVKVERTSRGAHRSTARELSKQNK
jgi:hypothetical protein